MPWASGDPVTLMKQHASAAPPDLGVLAPGLPPGVPEVVKKSLAKRPEDRYQSARELFAALEAAWPESPLAKKLSVSPEIVETAPARDGVDITARLPATRPVSDADSSAETLPADSVFAAEMLKGRKATPPQPVPPPAGASSPAQSDWNQKTEKTVEREELPTVRIRNVKKAQAEAAAQAASGPVPTEEVPPPTEKTAPRMLGEHTTKATGEILRKLRPRRWRYAVGALAAAAAAAWVQWGPK